MQIRHVIIKVDDQGKALAFYTSILGFVKTQDRRVGRFRWLTVSSPQGPRGAELVLEPNSSAPALASQKALYDAVFPATVLSTNDIPSNTNA
ncbi:MAG: VOC family protein [Steroidobacter sp.]